MPRLAPVRSSVRLGALVEVGINGSLVLRHGRGSRPSTSCSGLQSKAWMPGTRPDMGLALGIKPRLGPGLIRAVAAEFDAVVQPERAVVPEFELRRRDAPTAPARRARHLANNILGGERSDRLFECKTAFQRLRLLACPGADLRLLRPGGEISVGLFFGHRCHVAADADLPAQRFPMEQESGFWIGGEFAALRTSDMAKEHEALR